MSMSFSFSSSGRPEGERPDDTRPFRILVIADFSGRAGRGVAEPLAGRKAHKIDLDSFDSLPAKLGARVRLARQPAVEIPIASLDDLHPDEIHDKAEVFAALRELRKRAADPALFAQAAEDVKRWADEPLAPASQIEPKPEGNATPESEFAALLGTEIGHKPTREAASVDALIRQIVGPSIVPDRDPRQDELVSIIEQAIASEMLAVLHDPAWQAVEAAWRSLHMFVTGLELDETLELFALDAAPAELVGDAPALEDVLITRPVQTAGGVPWSLVLHLEQHTPETAATLGSLATLSHRAGAPLLTGANPGMLGVEKFTGTAEPEGWAPPHETLEILRTRPEAESVCLTAPRFLLRLPYGTSTDQIERFNFEEVATQPDHDALLWGSGAVLVALLLGQAFTEIGWDLQPIGGGTVEDLPVLTFDGGNGMIPCAETWLSDRSAAALAKRGVTPLLSVQNRGAVQVAGLRSLAGGPLACRWG